MVCHFSLIELRIKETIVNISAKPLVSSVRRAAADAEVQRAAAFLTGLSNPVRLAVLLRITQREWSVNELADDLRISQSALSQHLSKLRQAEIVTGRRDRQTVFYSCSKPLAVAILSLLGIAS